VFVRGQTETDADIEEALDRARKYLAAGADCVYPILVHQEQTVARLVQGIPGPVNIFALPELPPVPRLRELGVRRISFAGRLQRAALAELRARLERIKTDGTL
jgi:2-methylisocitrate lyase-like PEP mutase family enzyme